MYLTPFPPDVWRKRGVVGQPDIVPCVFQVRCRQMTKSLFKDSWILNTVHQLIQEIITTTQIYTNACEAYTLNKWAAKKDFIHDENVSIMIVKRKQNIHCIWERESENKSKQELSCLCFRQLVKHLIAASTQWSNGMKRKSKSRPLPVWHSWPVLAFPALFQLLHWTALDLHSWSCFKYTARNKVTQTTPIMQTFYAQYNSCMTLTFILQKKSSADCYCAYFVSISVAVLAGT